jgi:dTDP-glucose pyrophosphorylase
MSQNILKGKFSENWNLSRIPRNASLKDALKAITESGSLMACLENESSQLIGILTDSDIRRALLEGARLDSPAFESANLTPIIASAAAPTLELREICIKQGIREIPLVDESGCLLDVFIMGAHEIRFSEGEETPFPRPPLKSPLFILAGGLGTRLRPAVSDRPKPLAMVGDQPLLGTLLRRARKCGFRQFYVATHHMSEQVEGFLNQAEFSDLKIKILKEPFQLGTAGSMGYVAEEIAAPMLVCNADVLTTVPFDKVVHFHIDERADITCVVRTHLTKVPFGVVDVSKGNITGIREKPEFENFVSSGIYVLSPDIIKMVQKEQYLDMPDLIRKCLEQGKRVRAFFLHEYWLDVGNPEDYKKANDEYETIFGKR